jgi:hypothetical protein
MIVVVWFIMHNTYIKTPDIWTKTHTHILAVLHSHPCDVSLLNTHTHTHTHNYAYSLVQQIHLAHDHASQRSPHTNRHASHE